MLFSADCVLAFTCIVVEVDDKLENSAYTFYTNPFIANLSMPSCFKFLKSGPVIKGINPSKSAFAYFTRPA